MTILERLVYLCVEQHGYKKAPRRQGFFRRDFLEIYFGRLASSRSSIATDAIRSEAFVNSLWPRTISSLARSRINFPNYRSASLIRASAGEFSMGYFANSLANCSTVYFENSTTTRSGGDRRERQ